ncbi:MAG: type II toxin-antitoxin system Phd/YefM family antitoxin [Acidobacteria bacterium]|nr:type II toxin-antitoxin system Phd/YefM family antitoxin [Acidobacteriota bacterium]
MNDTVNKSEVTPLRVSEDIVPLGEFRAQAAQVLRRLRASGRAVVITQNGRPAAVLVAPEEYDRLQEHGRFVAAVGEGLADVEAGRVVRDEDFEDAPVRKARRPRR